MIRVLDIHAKDIYVTLEVPLSFIESTLLVLEMSEFKYDSSKPGHAELKKFLTDELYNGFKEILKEVKGGH